MAEHDTDQLTVAVIDDDADIRASLRQVLETAGYAALDFSGLAGVKAGLAAGSFDAVLVDLDLGAESGLDLFPLLAEARADVPVAVISGTADIKLAVEALKRGAREFFEKPLSRKPILAWLGAISRQRSIGREHRQLLDATLSRYALLGDSAAMAELRRRVDELAPLREPVLVWGETGTGKELVAAQLHYRSARRAKAWQAVNVAALSDSLVESQLFGHTRGAFSGADEKQPGLIQAAHGSTLFLDEIGEMKMELQAKLLRVLQDREVLSIGSTKPVAVDLRFVFATNRDLEEECRRQRFRLDLLYRIKGLEIWIPPLRERVGDISLLADAFLKEYAREYNVPSRGFSPEALDRLSAHPFPGNVRELKSHTLYALLKANRRNGLVVEAEDLPAAVLELSDPVEPPATTPQAGRADDPFWQTGDLLAMKQALEKRYIQTQLAKHGGSVPETARSLGLHPSNLYRKLREHHISPQD
jgi:DNA-binding NtrC family response regulator